MKPKFILIAALILIHMAAYSETEPNNNMQQANNLLYNGSETGTLTGTDTEDWFVINIPQGGIFTLTVKKTGYGNGTLYLYDGEKEGYPEVSNLYVGFGDSPEKGLMMTVPLTGGKYYVKFLKFSDPVNYQMSASLVLPSYTEDKEPNDTVTKAITMPETGSISGNLRYYITGKGIDREDWYKIQIPQGGILKLTVFKKGPGNTFIRFRDGIKQGFPEISNFYTGYGESPAEGWTWSCPVLTGTYYFQIEGGEYYLDYKLDVSLAVPVFTEDSEPNDSVKSAVTKSFPGSISGNIRYYVDGKGSDQSDWFKIQITKGGILNLRIYKKGPGNTWIRFHDGLKSGIPEISNFYTGYWESPAEGWTWSYPVLVGTYYFEISGGEYIVDYKFDMQLELPVWGEDAEPNDSLKYAKNFSLNDSIGGLIGYYKPGYGPDNWDWFVFETPRYGLLSFNIDKKGFYNCNFRLRDTINEISSQYIGFGDQNAKWEKQVTAGKYYVGAQKNEGDFQYKIRLKYVQKPKASFSWVKTDNIYTFDNTSQRAESYAWNFDDGNTSKEVNPVHEYKSPGTFYACLIVSNTGGKDTSCITVAIPGISRAYPNYGGNTGDATVTVWGGALDTLFKISLKKDGNIIASSSKTGFGGKGSLVGFFDLRNKPTGTFDIVVEKPNGPKYTIPGGFKITQGTGSNPWVNIDGRDRILFNTWTTYKIQYGNNGNVDAVGVPLWLAVSEVPGMEIKLEGFEYVFSKFAIQKGYGNIGQQIPEYVVLDSLMGRPGKVRVYIFQIPVIPPAMSNSIILKIKTPGNIQIHAWMQNPYFASPFDAGSCIVEALGKAVLQTAAGAIDRVGCIVQIGSSAYDLYQIAYDKDRPADKPAIGVWMANWAISMVECGISLSAAGLIIKTAVNIVANSTQFALSSADCIRNAAMKDKDIKAVSSLDPNEKTGPSGFGADNYVAATRIIPYTIYFENKANASAPAHTVTITDQLDETKFDLSSFSFGDVYVGDSLFSIKSGLKEFALDKKLDKLKVVARIIGKLDTLTGKLEWTLRSLDPVTFDNIEDPDIGLLPPNKTSPEGQGSVSFFARLKSDPMHKTSVTNQASIVFDANPAIITNKHLTTFDLSVPQSAVQSLTATTSARQFTVKWSGSDDGSGIGGYNIYVKANNGPYNIWLAGTTETSAIYKSPADGTFQFSSVAVDKVGNTETLSETPDATTNVVTAVDDQGIPGLEAKVYPSPSKDELSVNISIPGRFTFRIYGTDGRLRMEKTMNGNSITNIKTGSLPRGLYLWQLVNDEFSVKKSGKFVVNE